LAPTIDLMKIYHLIVLLFLSLQVWSQGYFESHKLKTDSLNKLNSESLNEVGVFAKKKIKTGLWTEYELVNNFPEPVPAVIQAKDTSINILFPLPSELQKREGLYNKGLKNKRWRWFIATYDENEQIVWKLIKETEFKDDKKNGIEKEYGSFGEVIRWTTYSKDVYDGQAESYVNSNLTHRMLYRKGLLQIITGYYENGKVRAIENHEQAPIIRIVRYHENGKVKEKYSLNQGELDGLCEAYDDGGNLTVKKFYKRGIEVNK
jgi:antitoxin component YwqK of YwqJK toxin-antitoxin module